MLNQFINIINSSNIKIEDDSVYIIGYVINDLNCLKFLNGSNCINRFSKDEITVYYDDLKTGDIINIELSLLHLNSIGYYETLDNFINKNRYSVPKDICYIREIKCFNTENSTIIDSHKAVVLLIDAIKKIAQHNYSEHKIDYSFIFREDKGLLLSFKYDSNDIKQIDTNTIATLNEITDVLDERNHDKKQKLIFINELIDFLKGDDENNKFKFLLSNINSFLEKANCAYQYYIRDFTYSKLKAELHDGTLKHLKNIQSIINDAQTKLIAIPTAFVLAVSSIDFSNISSNKNIAIILSLFIFSGLIEIFIKNQESALKFIRRDIDFYKGSFEKMEKIVKENFEIVDKEWKKQNVRIMVVRWITWGIPILLSIVLTLMWRSRICLK